MTEWFGERFLLADRFSIHKLYNSKEFSHYESAYISKNEHKNMEQRL